MARFVAEDQRVPQSTRDFSDAIDHVALMDVQIDANVWKLRWSDRPPTEFED